MLFNDITARPYGTSSIRSRSNRDLSKALSFARNLSQIRGKNVLLSPINHTYFRFDAPTAIYNSDESLLIWFLFGQTHGVGSTFTRKSLIFAPGALSQIPAYPGSVRMHLFLSHLSRPSLVAHTPHPLHDPLKLR